MSSTATIRQISHAGKKEPTILKEGARVQLVSDSKTGASTCLTGREVCRATAGEVTPGAIELYELGEALNTVRKPLREIAWCSSLAQI